MSRARCEERGGQGGAASLPFGTHSAGQQGSLASHGCEPCSLATRSPSIAHRPRTLRSRRRAEVHGHGPEILEGGEPAGCLRLAPLDQHSGVSAMQTVHEFTMAHVRRAVCHHEFTSSVDWASALDELTTFTDTEIDALTHDIFEEAEPVTPRRRRIANSSTAASGCCELPGWPVCWRYPRRPPAQWKSADQPP